ncbi:hypothetical protein PMAYCL1PPCAC_16963, partial [Pristionchus mayeri]
FSDLFFPPPDALRVFSRDNSSYWLILFVRSEFLDSWRSIYLIGVIAEIILMCIGAVFNGRTVFLCWKYKILHANFLALVTNVYVSFEASCLARTVIVLYESRLISWSDIANTPIPYVAVIREYGLVHAYCLLSVLTIERIIATIYVEDYELKHRIHFSILLILTVDCVMLAISYAFVAGKLHFHFMGFF